jgi:hypothetical protein
MEINLRYITYMDVEVKTTGLFKRWSYLYDIWIGKGVFYTVHKKVPAIT